MGNFYLRHLRFMKMTNFLRRYAQIALIVFYWHVVSKKSASKQIVCFVNNWNRNLIFIAMMKKMMVQIFLKTENTRNCPMTMSEENLKSKIIAASFATDCFPKSTTRKITSKTIMRRNLHAKCVALRNRLR